MSKAMQRPMGQMPAWLVFSGVGIGVVGASVKKHAESVGELVVPLSGWTENSEVAMAIALGQWGSLLLVAGAVVVVAGLVVIALAGRHKQRRAMDPRRCSVACGRATSAPLWSAASSLVSAGPDPGNPGDACPAHHRTRH